MKPALVVPCLLLALLTVSLNAATRVEFSVTNLVTGATTKRVVLIDVGQIKVDLGPRVVLFFTNRGDRLIQLDRQPNIFRVSDQASLDDLNQIRLQLDATLANLRQTQLKAMTPEQRAAADQAAKDRTNSSPKEATQWITRYAHKGAGRANGFPCTNYDGIRDGWTDGEKVFEICEASFQALNMSEADSRIVERMRDFAFKVNQGPRDMGMGYLSKNGYITSAIEEKVAGGFPVRATRFADGKAVEREDLISVTSVTVTAAEFSTGNAKKEERPVPKGR